MFMLTSCTSLPTKAAKYPSGWPPVVGRSESGRCGALNGWYENDGQASPDNPSSTMNETDVTLSGLLGLTYSQAEMREAAIQVSCDRGAECVVSIAEDPSGSTDQAIHAREGTCKDGALTWVTKERMPPGDGISVEWVNSEFMFQNAEDGSLVLILKKRFTSLDLLVFPARLDTVAIYRFARKTH